MVFKLFKRKSKPDLKSSGSSDKKSFHNKDISRPLQLPFPSSVSLHDIRDSLIHPIPDLHTRRRSKSTSSSAGAPDKHDKHSKQSPELFSKDADPFAPPVPKIPAVYQNGEGSVRSSLSNRDDSTHTDFQYRDSQSSRLGRPSGDTSAYSKTEPPKRPPRTRRPIPFIGMSNLLKKKTTSPENERASPPPRTAKVSFTQSIKGLGMKNKNLRHSASDESFESLSVYSIMRSPPLQSIPPPRPSRSPPPAPTTGRARSSTVSGAPPVQESQVLEARLSNASNAVSNRKRSNSSPSARQSQTFAANNHSSLHSIPFSLQAIQPSSSTSSIPNARSSSGISVKMETQEDKEGKEGDEGKQGVVNKADQTTDTKVANASHDQSGISNSSTFSSFNDGNNSFDPSQFLNSYTKDDSYTSFELDKSILSPSSSKKDFNNSSLMVLGPSPSSHKFNGADESVVAAGEDEEVISNGSQDVLNVPDNGTILGSEFFKADTDTTDRSKIFSSLEAVKKHMSTDSFGNDTKESEDAFLDTLSNFSSPPPLLALRPLSPINVKSIDEGSASSETEEGVLDDSPTRRPSQRISGLVLTSSPNRDSASTVAPTQPFNDAQSDVDADVDAEEEAEEERAAETGSILRDSVSIYDDDEMTALQKKIEDMAKKLEQMRRPGASSPLHTSTSKESLPPSFSFHLDPNDHPELQDGVTFADDAPPQDIALPAAGPDEIALPESPLDDAEDATDAVDAHDGQKTPPAVPITASLHSKSCSFSGSIEDHTTSTSFHVANANASSTSNASSSPRSSQEEEMEEAEDNKVIQISPESQKKLQTQLRRISKQPAAVNAPAPRAAEAAPKGNQKPSASVKPQAQKRAEISSISLRDWMPTPLSPKIVEESEPADDQQQGRQHKHRRGLKEIDLNVAHNEPNMVHPPRFSSFKATPHILSQAQIMEKKQYDRRTRETWLKPSDSLSTLSKAGPAYNNENRGRRISQQPIDNSILPKRHSSKGVKGNTSWQHSIEREFDSIYEDPSGEKRRSELEQQQVRARMAMDAAWRAARSSSVPPVEDHAYGGTKQRKSLLLPQKKELMHKKMLPTLPYSAPANKTSFASGLEGVRNRDSQQLPALPSMRSLRASIEVPQYNPRASQQDRRINAAVESSIGYGQYAQSKSMNSMPPATASNGARKNRPARLDQLGPNQHSKSLTYFNSHALQTPPLTATSSASSMGYDSVMTPRSFTHKHDASASSMDSMSAHSVSSEGSVRPSVANGKKHASFLPASRSGYSLKGDSGYGYAI
ncbi:hypothetical protein E3P99_04099 [Wallemia hederae]|uniref:Uncharacterized protein n=1 Tax=Wallemia hederae TaxID=1540922 RepID=A0A4V4LS35_9BASI|nr:hypothetical protein E3P99_04099 [Wallemia hederae]